jgi:hypothetical protein
MSILPALGVALAFTAVFLSPANVSAQDTVTVPVGDVWFCSSANQGGVCETTIDAGDTVVWDFNGALLPHTTTECGASCDAPSSSRLWNSGTISGGGTFSYTFAEPGTYLYFCQIHPDVQRGRIVVRAASEPTQPPSNTPGANATPAPGGGSLPPTGQGGGDNDGSSGAGSWFVAAAGLAIGGMGLVYYGARNARKKSK